MRGSRQIPGQRGTSTRQQVRTESPVEDRDGPGAGTPVGTVLRLQEMAGNAAVVRLLADRAGADRGGAGRGRFDGAPTVQRQPPAPGGSGGKRSTGTGVRSLEMLPHNDIGLLSTLRLEQLMKLYAESFADRSFVIEGGQVVRLERLMESRLQALLQSGGIAGVYTRDWVHGGAGTFALQTAIREKLDIKKAQREREVLESWLPRVIDGIRGDEARKKWLREAAHYRAAHTPYDLATWSVKLINATNYVSGGYAYLGGTAGPISVIGHAYENAWLRFDAVQKAIQKDLDRAAQINAFIVGTLLAAVTGGVGGAVGAWWQNLKDANKPMAAGITLFMTRATQGGEQELANWRSANRFEFEVLDTTPAGMYARLEERLKTETALAHDFLLTLGRHPNLLVDPDKLATEHFRINGVELRNIKENPSAWRHRYEVRLIREWLRRHGWYQLYQPGGGIGPGRVDYIRWGPSQFLSWGRELGLPPILLEQWAEESVPGRGGGETAGGPTEKPRTWWEEEAGAGHRKR